MLSTANFRLVCMEKVTNLLISVSTNDGKSKVSSCINVTSVHYVYLVPISKVYIASHARAEIDDQSTSTQRHCVVLDQSIFFLEFF